MTAGKQTACSHALEEYQLKMKGKFNLQNKLQTLEILEYKPV